MDEINADSGCQKIVRHEVCRENNTKGSYVCFPSGVEIDVVTVEIDVIIVVNNFFSLYGTDVFRKKQLIV